MVEISKVELIVMLLVALIDGAVIMDAVHNIFL